MTNPRYLVRQQLLRSQRPAARFLRRMGFAPPEAMQKKPKSLGARQSFRPMQPRGAWLTTAPQMAGMAGVAPAPVAATGAREQTRVESGSSPPAIQPNIATPEAPTLARATELAPARITNPAEVATLTPTLPQLLLTNPIPSATTDERARVVWWREQIQRFQQAQQPNLGQMPLPTNAVQDAAQNAAQVELPHKGVDVKQAIDTAASEITPAVAYWGEQLAQSRAQLLGSDGQLLAQETAPLFVPPVLADGVFVRPSGLSMEMPLPRPERVAEQGRHIADAREAQFITGASEELGKVDLSVADIVTDTLTKASVVAANKMADVVPEPQKVVLPQTNLSGLPTDAIKSFDFGDDRTSAQHTPTAWVDEVLQVALPQDVAPPVLGDAALIAANAADVQLVRSPLAQTDDDVTELTQAAFDLPAKPAVNPVATTLSDLVGQNLRSPLHQPDLLQGAPMPTQPPEDWHGLPAPTQALPNWLLGDWPDKTENAQARVDKAMPQLPGIGITTGIAADTATSAETVGNHVADLMAADPMANGSLPTEFLNASGPKSLPHALVGARQAIRPMPNSPSPHTDLGVLAQRLLPLIERRIAADARRT